MAAKRRSRKKLQTRLGYRFKRPELLDRALRHASASGGDLRSNERVEYLGDAVVGLVVSEHLYRTLPDATEGEMTTVKSAVVSRQTLARAGESLELRDHIEMDPGLASQQTLPISIIANAYEAVAGAIYLDGGLEPAAAFVLRTLAPELERVMARRHAPSYKSILQHRTQAEGKGLPRYRILQSEGPDHEPRFEAVVRIGKKESGRGWGPTKKEAEQNAAHDALESLYPGWERQAGRS